MNYIWENIFRRSTKGDAVRGALRHNALFESLSESELKVLESIVHIRQYHAGEPVFRQGDLGVGMYIIVKGRIEIFVSDSANALEPGHEVLITQLVSGDFFGELALVEDNGRRPASAIARDESTLIGFFKPDLGEIAKRSPSAGIKILTRLAEVLGRRLKETTEKISELRGDIRGLRGSQPPHAEKR